METGKKRRLRLIWTRPAEEGDGSGIGHTFGVRVDGAAPRGLWPPDVGGLCSLRSGGDSACGAEGCGLPLRAMLIKSALRDLLSVSYSMISILLISRYAAPPYPAAPDFLHGKACHTILRSLCSLTNRVPLPPHPGDRTNCSMLSCRGPWLHG